MKRYQRSNLGHRSRCGRLRQGRRGGGAASGSAPGPQRRFTGAGASRGTHLGGPRTAGATEVGCVTVVGLIQPSAMSTTSSNGRPVMRLGYSGAARHVERRCGVGFMLRGLQQSGGELGRWLGFQYLRIKIHHRTGTTYRAFCTKS
jgi:hypothetical protein